jgi:tRNA threonylcarbamoyladenosine biosynthesis protein TsaB
MRIVALDTSTWWGSVALLEGGRGEPSVVATAGLLVRASHAVHLLRLLDGLMAEAGWAKDSVDAYAATRGPGSFTGLRVGLGTVRGLALAASRPAYGVGTLDALAEAHGPAEGLRVPLLDAGRGEVYGAVFDASGSPARALGPPWVGPPETAASRAGAPAVAFGPGAEAHREILQAAGVAVRRRPLSVAAAAGRLACDLFRRNAEDGTGMEPLYVRPPDAVRKGEG